MTMYRIAGQAPEVDDKAYIAEEATVIGRVRVGARSSVWPGAVVRGDNEPITIGDETSIQEGAVLHADPGFPLTVGRDVSVGHQAMLHGCTIGDGSLIGIQAVVLNGAVIGRDSLVGAGAIVTERKSFPDRSLIIGAPAKVVRTLTDEDVQRLQGSADNYVARAELYLTKLEKI
jgi:carbonic anhydrase/acetyltransferase-like protein (isoleucine patch superfamily)